VLPRVWQDAPDFKASESATALVDAIHAAKYGVERPEATPG